MRGGLALALAFVAAPLVRRWHLRWGATDSEVTAAMPGDDVVPDARTSTRAISIAAPPEAVWPWLVQMGQDRAGFYSYDLLERLAGARIHNADEIVAEWQTLRPGDLMRTYRYVARFEPLGWIVVTVDAERALVVRNVKSTWSWSLVLQPDVSGGSRLIARTRSAPMGPVSAALEMLTGEPMHFVMEVGVLRGVKHRAEGPGAELKRSQADA